MTNDTQTECTTGVKASPGRRQHTVALSLILLLAIVAAVGCSRIGKTDRRLAGSWYDGLSSLLLNADGTYVMTVRDAVFPSQTNPIINQSGTWGVTNNRLNLKPDKSDAILTYDYKLNDRGDQLQLTLNSTLNPNRISVTYSTSRNPYAAP
jgi:hypothetical protein